MVTYPYPNGECGQQLGDPSNPSNRPRGYSDPRAWSQLKTEDGYRSSGGDVIVPKQPRDEEMPGEVRSQ